MIPFTTYPSRSDKRFASQIAGHERRIRALETSMSQVRTKSRDAEKRLGTLSKSKLAAVGGLSAAQLDALANIPTAAITALASMTAAQITALATISSGSLNALGAYSTAHISSLMVYGPGGIFVFTPMPFTNDPTSANIVTWGAGIDSRLQNAGLMNT